MKSDIYGQVYGRLTVKSDAPRKTFPSGSSRRMLVCACECGQQSTVGLCDLRTGKTRSCGCLRREVARDAVIRRSGTTDRLLTPDESRIFHVWRAMLRRCTSKNSKSFKDYGARGIVVCERWMQFDNFLEDMGIPVVGLTLERKNNDGNYEQGNCVWTDRKDQNRNKRSNVFVEFNGKRQCISEWAEALNVAHDTLRYRLDHWPIERALTSGPGWAR